MGTAREAENKAKTVFIALDVKKGGPAIGRSAFLHCKKFKKIKPFALNACLIDRNQNGSRRAVQKPGGKAGDKSAPTASEKERKKEMKPIRNFIARHKKAVLFTTVLVAAIAVGLCFTAQPIPSPTARAAGDAQQAGEQTEKLHTAAQESAAGGKEPASAASTAPAGSQAVSAGEDRAVSTEPEEASAEPTEENGENTPSSASGKGDETARSPEESAHTHNWQPHTTQRWVPELVTVVDTPEQTIYGAQLYTENADGTWTSNGETYWFENGFTMEDFKVLLVDKMKNEGYIGNYVNRTKTVPAVTHEEDRGHYESYTDFCFCSCGAVK